MHSPSQVSKRQKSGREMPKQVDATKSQLALSQHSDNGLGEEAASFFADEQELHHFDDLTKVNPVTAATVLKCLQARYVIDIFYTNAGCSLVAVNPFRPIPALYSQDLMKAYHHAFHLQDLKPHVFVVAEETYRNVQSQIRPVNQSIIVSGESGAGKTWTSRCLMKFYATVAASSAVPAGSVTVERIEKRVLDSNPLMEAFGNACTLRNVNSSRFGKYIQLQLNSTQHLTSATIQTFLLEKTRVTYQAPQERNFHIFYQIAKGATQEERLEWNLPEGASFRWLPNPEKVLEEDNFEETREAMTHLGISGPMQSNVFKILAGLLHLGNIQFLESEDESQPCELAEFTTDFAKTASGMFQVRFEDLLETLRIRTITAGKQRQVFKKPCSKTECDTRRECLAKVIYARVFDWLVAVINESIYADPSVWSNFIGLLDVYGFESFPENHLEQLCINYANEKLQQHFVGHFLKAQQEEYVAEGLEWSFISYQDNQGCLDVIEGNPVSIFSLLNEECRLSRPSNGGQLQTRLEVALSGNRYISRDRFHKKPNFIVSHYAGDVCYQVEGMVEKNKDPVPPELLLLLQQSQDSLLRKLFPATSSTVRANENDVKAQTKTPVVTVVSKFKGSLEQLMSILQSTTPHYIRCIKPNADCQAAQFRKDEVLQQLEACGIVEAINISAAGFPIRIAFQSFLDRYKVLKKRPRPTPSAPARGDGVPHETATGPDTSTAEEEDGAVRSMVQQILGQTCPCEPAEKKPGSVPVYCGKTKVFMTNAMLEQLEARRAATLSVKALCIQCCWRRFKRWKLARERQSATIIQSAIRSWLVRKHFQRLRKAVATIKRAWKKWKAKMVALAEEELDDGGRALPSISGRGALPSQSHGQFENAWPPQAVIQLWPLGLVLARSPATLGGLQRGLALLACLPIVWQSEGGKAEVQPFAHGVVSVRALPQGPIKFRCRKSLLLYADTRPHSQLRAVTGFNQILLDRETSLSA